MTTEQIHKIKERAKEQRITYPQWRAGQSIFNAAFELYPYQADQIRSTFHDCFYDDLRIEEFLNALERLDK